jgi:hypothetical protein
MNNLEIKTAHLIQSIFSPRDQAMERSLEGIIDTLVIVTLAFVLFGIPMATAQEATQTHLQDNSQAQPVVQATGTTPEAGGAVTPTKDDQFSQDSLDFLMESQPISGGPSNASAGSTVLQQTNPTTVTEPLPAVLPDLKNLKPEKSEEIAMLVSEQCSQSGPAGQGTNSCERIYSNGHRATVLTQNSNEGDETKSQTVVEEFDETRTLLYKKTIRHRVDYNYFREQKAKEKEFFDIIYQPEGKKTTRELMVYEYFLDTGKARSLAWTQYKQIGNEPKAGLAYHALLRYSEDGSPERGLAEKWNDGKKTETFINWNRYSRGYATLDQEAWGQWEGWIRNVSMQAYLP